VYYNENMKFIDEMKERPEDERMAFAVMAAGVVALLLFLVWGATFFTSSKKVVEVKVSDQGASVTEGFKDIGDELSGAVGEFSAQYNQLKQALDEAGIGDKSQGVNTVDLRVDKDGDVHVDNIIVEKEELMNE